MTTHTQEKTIERFGWITKEEPLSVVDDTNLALTITVLESTAPFFGYYADQPREDKPEHLYWVLDHPYTHEKIFRVIDTIRTKCYPNLDATPGNIFIGGENYHVVRIHNLKRYNQMHAVQEIFEAEGIMLKKLGRKIHNQMGLICLSKFLQLIPMGDGLYGGAENPHRAYFTIPEHLDWEDFKKVTKEVKFDSTLLFFDAARAAFREKGVITDLVRVFRENLTVEQLKAIRDRYHRVIMQRS